MRRFARLTLMLDEMQAEIDELRGKVDKQPPAVKYEPIPANPAFSTELDAQAMSAEVSEQHSYYNEEADVYSPNTYL